MARTRPGRQCPEFLAAPRLGDDLGPFSAIDNPGHARYNRQKPCNIK